MGLQIKKFKDALAKYGTGSGRCTLAPPKGLDETELLKLASIGEISLDLPFSTTREDRVEHLVLKNIDLIGSLDKAGKRKMELEEEKRTIFLA